MTTRQPYKPKYIPLYAARSEKKETEAPAHKLEQQDISELRQQIDDFREEIRTSPVSYPKEPMADPHRRFAIPTDLSRFERLRRGLRREEDADINLGANYSRYRLETRRNVEDDDEVPETRTTRVSKRDRDHNELSTNQTRLRSNSRSRNPPQQYLNKLHIQGEEEFEDQYAEIKEESHDEDTSLYHPMPQMRRYAGYNAFTGSPQKKVTITEPQEKPQEKHMRPRSRDPDTRAEHRIHEATRLVEDKLEQYMGAIEASKGPEVAQQFVREYELMMDLLSKEYQGFKDFQQKQPTQTPISKTSPKSVSKTTQRSASKKGIIKMPTQSASRRPTEDINDDYEEERDIEQDYGKKRPQVKIEKQEEDARPENDSRRAQKGMHELKREITQTPTKSLDPHTPQKVVIPNTGVWARARSTISRSCRAVVGTWQTTTSPLLLLATSFFFWQAIRLALTFFCLDDDEEFVRQQLVQGMSYAEIEHMWGLRGFNICGGVWRPPVPQ
ncbi:Hypothetical protein conserved in the Yarrowia clade [Yarrowia lipolytica]|nr:Hypothetical protein conserved in the Yarrowia clade [Yarrowia lipolytica]